MRYLLLGFGLALSSPLIGSLIVTGSTSGRLHRDIAEVEPGATALVLGTSPNGQNGPNPFFEGRMDAAAELYREGKVKHILVSGDNGTVYYNEPVAMQKGLVKRGIPKSAIELDYAGFRTLDSVVRAKDVFGAERITIVTDDFHASRALYIARHHGVEAQAYVSSVALRDSMRVRVREVGSRCKMLLDLYVLGTEPKFNAPQTALRLKPTSAE